MVRLPLTYIDNHLEPEFRPPLEDDKKQWGEKWKNDLPVIYDPANKYVRLHKIEIVPERAKTFVKNIPSSNRWTNSTQLLYIAAGDGREVTGNVSFFLWLSAFNQN